MTSGRKPTPTALKLVKGNPGKRALNKREAKTQPSKSSPPPFLNEDALAEWERVAGLLFTAGLMTELDRAVLAAYCQAYGRWAEAERALARMAAKDEANRALMVKTVGGNAIQNPLVGIANKAKADMVKYAVEFGMTPSARAKVAAGDPAAPADPAQEFFG
jgi:P27 family predicted phage terminase small subunit